MGFSLVAAFAVIGVSILVAIEIFTGSMLPTVTETDESYNDMVDRNVDRVQTDINITNVVITAIAEPIYEHNFTVENTGSVSLNTSDFTILINGTSYQYTCSDYYLFPGKEAYFTVTDVVGEGDMKAKIITHNGISDYYEYTVP